MKDVKPPHPLTRTSPDSVVPALHEWLLTHGLSDLIGTLAEADQMDTWASHANPIDFGPDLKELARALARPHSADKLREDPGKLLPDLDYVLSHISTSHAMHMLCQLHSLWPGVTASLLRNDATDPRADATAAGAQLANRVLYLIRHQAIPAVFSAERRAEVQAAIAAAHSGNDVL